VRLVKKVLFEDGKVAAQYQGQVPSMPTYDLLQDQDYGLTAQLGAFESHGYFRSGTA
jgi:hypothetical protein